MLRRWQKIKNARPQKARKAARDRLQIVPVALVGCQSIAAPTLARLLGVDRPEPYGKVLTAALTD